MADRTVTFLYASDGTSLTKVFKRPVKSKPIQKEPYPHVFRFDSLNVKYKSISSLARLLTNHGEKGACMLKGILTKELKNESRAKSTVADTPTDLLVLDFDGVTGIADVDAAIATLGLPPNVGYICQFSASMGIGDNTSFNAHIFLLIDQTVAPAAIKRWCIRKNLGTPLLNDQLKLTNSHNALRWPLDITVNQNDKLIYIAPPKVYDGIKNTCERSIIYKNGGHISASIFNEEGLPSVDKAKLNRLNQLRSELDLPPRKNEATKTIKGQIVSSAPLQATVTGIKEDRGFVYLNLNGGDSWGYYFPLTNPEVLKNFKGEQNYALKDIAPEVYEEYLGKSQAYIIAKQEAKLKNQTTGIAYIAFLDPATDIYYRGYYNYDTDELRITPTNSLIKVQHFLRQHGQPNADFIPEWDYIFDFKSDVLFDPVNKKLNRYSRTPYMRNPKFGDFPIIEKIIHHIMRGDDQSKMQMYNWLAFMVQEREPPRTAWLMHGIQGTGKGLFYNFILAPLLGEDYVQLKQLEDLEENFNNYMQNCLILMIDEIQISDSKFRSRVMAKLKKMISEPTLSLRGMRSNAIMVANWMSILFASNKPDPIEIDPTDRRINVAPYQPDKIDISAKEIAGIKDELHAFAYFLMNMEVDKGAARTPMDSAAKRHIQYLTRNSVDQFCDALVGGDLQYFFDGLPASSISAIVDIGTRTVMEESAYTQLVTRMFNSVLKPNKGRHRGVLTIPRNDLTTMALYLLGKVPETPHKFTAMMKHHGLNMKPIKSQSKTVQGITMSLNASEELLLEWRTHWTTDKELIIAPVRAVPPVNKRKPRSKKT